MRAIVILLLLEGVTMAGIWEEVGRQGRGDGGGNGAGPAATEARLRAVLETAPDDFQARRELAEWLSGKGRARDAAREFERAASLAPSARDEARIWYRVATERSRSGAYDEALDAYERQLALGDVLPAALSNSAELLMAKGRGRGGLSAAIDRYREAIVIEERETNRREHIQGIALSTFGLAVALDRDGQVAASREAIARALALDPGAASLRLGAPSESGVFFVPPGDVFYYIGLVREAQGRGDDAVAAYRDYLRVTTGRYGARAREHLAQLARSSANARAGRLPGSPPSGHSARPGSPDAVAGAAGGTAQQPGRGLRVLHQATVSSEGPLVAPLIDAAWRMDRRLLDSCLKDVALPATDVPAAAGGGDNTRPSTGLASPTDRRQFKVSLELRIEENGRVGAVKAKAPPALGEELARCMETEILSRFRVSRPATRKPTQARMELVLAPVAPGGV